MQTLNILLLGAGNRVSLCEHLISAVTRRGYAPRIYSLEAMPQVPIMKYATILLGKKWADPDFYSDLLNVVKTYNIHIILPLMDGATVALSAVRDQIEVDSPGTWACVSDPKLCETFNDKILSEGWFKMWQILIPSTSTQGFPRILKRRDGYGARDQFIVKTAEQYNSLKSNIDYSNYIDQAFIEGPEFTVDAYVARNGEVKGIVSRQRLAVVNGEVNRSVTKKEPVLISMVKHVLSKEGFEGPITLQAIQSKQDGQWYMIEINPRFGGGVIHSFKAGANFADAVVADYLGEPIPDLNNWEEGLLMMRANQEIWSKI